MKFRWMLLLMAVWLPVYGNEVIEQDSFPEHIPFSVSLPEQLNINPQGSLVELSYYDASASRQLYRELFTAVQVDDHQLAIKLGKGRFIEGDYSSVQALAANHPEFRVAITIDKQALKPYVGVKPAGHSIESMAILAGVKSTEDQLHWKGYQAKSTHSTVQQVTLGIDKLTGNEQIIARSPYTLEVIGPKMSKPMKSFPVAVSKAFQEQEINSLRHESLYDKEGNLFGTVSPQQDDPLAPKSAQNPGGFLTPSPSANFPGMPNISGFYPPDIEGAVGPDHYVQMVNSTYQIFDKITGASVAGPFTNNTLWSGFGGGCQNNNDGDPIALYDEMHDRWILTQFSVSTLPRSVCFAVSQTGDPTGDYYLYEVIAQRFPDYYKLGLWNVPGNTAIFMGTNSGQQNQYDVYAIDYENMRQGLPANPSQFFQNYPNLLMPADSDGASPAANTPGYFYTIRDGGEPYFGSPPNDSIDIYEFVVDWDTPANTTFTLAQVITNADGLTDFNWTVCGFFVSNCLEQPGTAVLIDSNSWWPQQRLQFRNFGTYQTLVGAWGVNAVPQPAKRSAIRWFELRKNTADPNWTYRQEGTFTPDTDHRFSPSISMDASGNIGLGYTVTSTTTFPSIRYTVHDSAVDPLGFMEPEVTMVAGTGSQTGSAGRWGDYASMDVDPVDGCTFWFTHEYIPVTSGASWQTQIGSFKVPSCEYYDVLPDDSEIQVCKTVGSASFDLTLTPDFDATTNLTQVGCPAGANCSFSPNPVVDPVKDATLNLTSLNSAGGGTYPITVTATDSVDNSKTADADLLLTLFDGTPGTPVLFSPADGAFQATLTPELSWGAVSDQQNYLLEVADSDDFSNIVFSTGTGGLSATTSTLNESTCYWWRVTPDNLCGNGISSSASTFYTGATLNTANFPSTDVPVTIPAVIATITSDLTIAGVGVINDVNVNTLDITHTWVSDLTIDLTSPQGTTVRIMNVGCTNRDDVLVTLDDEATPGTWSCNPAPVGQGGTFQPSNPLAAFDGEDADGTWTLTVIDSFNSDGGSLDGWGLSFQAFSDPGDQCPATNIDPTAVDDSATVDEDDPATTIDVQANDTDPDGGINTIQSVTQPANGAVVITNGGADLTYQPDADFCNDGTPTDDFTYTLNGGSVGTVAVTVNCVDDDPVAVNDSVTVTEDDPATTIDVISNDTDVDGGSNTIQSVTQPADGTVVITNAGADLTYQPDADFCNDGTPTDDFTYTLNGGSVGTVAVTVTCVDDDPNAVDDTATVTEDDPATTIDVISNDTDVDGGSNTVQSVTQPVNGTVVITNAGADLSYQPDADYCNDGTPTDDFTYTLNGGSAGNVAVTVTCVDDTPTAVNDTATITEDDPATTFDVLANDNNADGGPITIDSVTQPGNGLVVITNGGADLTYAPVADYCNDGVTTDDFTYTLNGGSVGTVAVTVNCVDDAPTANNDAATVTEDDPATTVDVLANDSNADGGPITIDSVTQPG
ncbi:Ig-like domain-containing protein, partial [Marinicella sediminis]|uniref:Ig-like domain-containing protein n=1 Tax=Marinicella sediminis TaxID=1792834 RepID=UPI0012FF815F